MTFPVPTRFSEDELRMIDDLVAHGVGDNRSEVIREAVKLLAEADARRRTGEAIAESYRRHPQGAEEDAFAMASAMALVEAEPW